MTARPGARPLPQPPGGLRNEAAWYEHEERMRPSYIAPQQQQAVYGAAAYAQQQGGYGGAGYAQPQRPYASPPTSPSARYQQQQQQQQQSRQAAYPFPGEQQQQGYAGALPPGAQAPYAYASQQQQYDYPTTPNRPRHSSMQPFPAHRLPNSQDPGYGGPPEAFEGMRGGTAFVVSRGAHFTQ